MRSKWFAHTTSQDFVFDADRRYVQRLGMKPSGLWCSELHDDGSDGWTDWRLSEEYEPEIEQNLRLAVRIDLTDMLICQHPHQLQPFQHVEQRLPFMLVDWEIVARQYRGIYFADYRCPPVGISFDPYWWNGIAVSSICVWNVGAVQEIRHGERPVPAAVSEAV